MSLNVSILGVFWQSFPFVPDFDSLGIVFFLGGRILFFALRAGKCFLHSGQENVFLHRRQNIDFFAQVT